LPFAFSKAGKEKEKEKEKESVHVANMQHHTTRGCWLSILMCTKGCQDTNRQPTE
jgi:hypothetical protein